VHLVKLNLSLSFQGTIEGRYEDAISSGRYWLISNLIPYPSPNVQCVLIPIITPDQLQHL